MPSCLEASLFVVTTPGPGSNYGQSAALERGALPDLPGDKDVRHVDHLCTMNGFYVNFLWFVK